MRGLLHLDIFKTLIILLWTNGNGIIVSRIHIIKRKKYFFNNRFIVVYYILQSSATSDADVNLESQSNTRLSDEKDSYFQDGKRKIGILLCLIL